MSELTSFLDVAAAIAALVIGVLALTTRRLGAGSWQLASFMLPVGLAAFSLYWISRSDTWSESGGTAAAYCLLFVAMPGALSYAQRLHCVEDPKEQSRARFTLLVASIVALGLAVTLASLVSGDSSFGTSLHIRPRWLLRLSGAGLVMLATIVLSRLERALRCSEDHVRWETKFVILGLATPLIAAVYLGSHALTQGNVFSGTIRTVSIILLPASLLIFVGWRRGSGRSGLAVSHRFAYGTVAWFGVGVYLIVSGLASAWTSDFFGVSDNARVLVVVVLVVLLAAALSTTRLRHRFRAWFRRNIFSGRYDYRSAWLEASATIRGSDPPDVAASSLCNIGKETLGSIDFSVWTSNGDDGALILSSAYGPKADKLRTTAPGVLEEIGNREQPIPRLDAKASKEKRALHQFFHETGAALVVPLRSNDETLGLVAVGSDRSGLPFDWNAVEFLRVLTRHAAGEFHKSTLLAERVQAKEDEAFRVFSTFLLHDLKNFASTLSMIAENATRHEDKPEFHHDAFNSVLDTAEKMKRLCTSLRTFSNNPAENRRDVDLAQVVQDAIEGVGHPLSHHIDVRLTTMPPLRIDADQISRVIRNLVINAAEASPTGARIAIESKIVNDRATLTVADTGCGIPSEFQDERLFVPFQTTKSQGLGIGLFQCRKIVEAHDGEIHIESDTEHGTKVEVSLPLPSSGEEPSD